MKTLKTTLFIILILISCKKPEKIHHPELTQEQLLWVQNLPNPTYQIIVQKNGNITSVDTIEIQSKMEVKEYEFRIGGVEFSPTEKIIYYYDGFYSLSFFDYYDFKVSVDIITGVEEKADFRASFYVGLLGPPRYSYGMDVSDISSDTANINSIVYDSVYKWTKGWKHYDNGISYRHTIYFKKGLGFLYLEKGYSDWTDTLIYTATMIQ